MAFATDTKLTVDMMIEVAQLATEISNRSVMPVQEMVNKAAKIAAEAGVVVTEVLDLLRPHVKHRTHGSHPSMYSHAYMNLMQSRDEKK